MSPSFFAQFNIELTIEIPKIVTLRLSFRPLPWHEHGPHRLCWTQGYLKASRRATLPP
jgi:hypothetical protein